MNSADAITFIKDNWQIVLSTMETLIIVGIAIYGLRQIREAVRSRYLQATEKMFDLLANDEIKQQIREVRRSEKSPRDLSEEDWDTVRGISYQFNRAGLLIYHNLLPKKIYLDMFSETTFTTWNLLKPYIEYQRERSWDRWQIHFEKLAEESEEYLRSKNPNDYYRLIYTEKKIQDASIRITEKVPDDA